jgi:hypothetical protein
MGTGAMDVCGFKTVAGASGAIVSGAGDIGVAGELFMRTTEGAGVVSASITLFFGSAVAKPTPTSSSVSRGDGLSVNVDVLVIFMMNHAIATPTTMLAIDSGVFIIVCTNIISRRASAYSSVWNLERPDPYSGPI